MIRLLRRRIRFIVLGAVLGGNRNRWMMYLAASAGLAKFRQYRRGTPEVIYLGRLAPEQHVSVLATKPLPTRFSTRRLRKAVEADARAELGD